MKINFDRATKRRYSVETVAPNRFYLTFAERNSRGEQITIGFTACKTHPESRADLAAGTKPEARPPRSRRIGALRHTPRMKRDFVMATTTPSIN